MSGKIDIKFEDESLLENTINKRDHFADIYFRVITDFIKWTTTISIAIIIFIANILSSKQGLNFFTTDQELVMFASLFFLIISILFAIIIFSSAITYWSYKWQNYQKATMLLTSEVTPFFDESQKPVILKYMLGLFSKSSDQLLEKSYRARYENYQYGVLAHLFLMLVGIISFIIGYFLEEPLNYFYFCTIIMFIPYVLMIVYIYLNQKKLSQKLSENISDKLKHDILEGAK
jgi:hypothetical protein